MALRVVRPHRNSWELCFDVFHHYDTIPGVGNMQGRSVCSDSWLQKLQSMVAWVCCFGSIVALYITMGPGRLAAHLMTALNPTSCFLFYWDVKFPLPQYSLPPCFPLHNRLYPLKSRAQVNLLCLVNPLGFKCFLGIWPQQQKKISDTKLQ